MNQQTQKQTYLNQNKVEPLVFTPLARSPDSRIEVFPEGKALQFDGHPQLVPIINNQRINRVLSRFPVNIPTRFAPSLPRGEKTFEPSTKMRERLQSLQRNLAQVYAPEKEIRIKGEIPLSSISIQQPKSSATEEIQQLREQLARKEQELAKEKSKEKALSEMVKVYQAQIESLTQKTKGLTAEIEQTEGELPHLRKQTKLLREKVSQEKPSYQQKEKDVIELKNSLFRSKRVVGELQEKISQKEKTLQNILVQTQSEREKAQRAISERQAVEALVKNLRAALQNAREELERSKKEEMMPEIVRTKEEQIKKLTERLQQKEKDTEKAKEEAEEASRGLAQEENIKAEIAQFQGQVKNLQEQNRKLTIRLQGEGQELAKLQTSVGKLAAQNKEKEEKLIQQEKHVSALREQKQKLASFADDLSKKLNKVQSEKHLETVVEAELSKKQAKKPAVKIVSKTAEEVFVKPLTSLPNTINGIVMTADEKLIEDAVVIIKDKTGNSLRALRTNELGQFLAATPLPNGIYRIELEKDREEFDILEVELTGEVLAPIEIRAK